LIGARNFLSLRAWTQREDGLVVNSTVSCEHPDAPPDKSYIRGLCQPSGMVLKAHEDESTMAYYVIRSEPKGWIPNAVVNKVVGATALEFFVTMNRLAKEGKLTESLLK